MVSFSVMRRFNWLSSAILLTFSGAWVAMILLTMNPGSEVLWAININMTRLFGEAFYLMQDTLGFSVVDLAVVTGVAGAVALVAGRNAAPVRFLSAHLAAVLVSIPMIHAVVASGGPDSAFLVAAPGWAWSDLLRVDALRLPLMALAALACLASHAELLARVRRDAAIRDRGRRLLAAA
ncbi:MAG TPA: hypothetical protein VMP03_03270 [Methylomirabilota bacterium]|nr:hypothetical protein [Methylomirabilota bacterium]